jgi:DNA-directed RNA polymerase subunit RPC12/RpoP
MSVIFGWKHADVTKTGYKSDFCESCKSPAIIDEWKWFTWGHLFGIPLLPLGYIHTWICSRCNRKTSPQPSRASSSKSNSKRCHYCSIPIMKHPYLLCAKCNLQFYP